MSKNNLSVGFKQYYPVMLKNITLILLIFISLRINAQQPVYENYTIEDGIPSLETYDIIQDSSGFIWVCSDHGISRYNGYEFQNFSSKDGLPDNTITRAGRGNDEKIWFISMNSRLSYWHNGKIINPVIRNWANVGNTQLHEISQGEGGDMWLSTTQGLARLSQIDSHVYEIEYFRSDYIFYINKNGIISPSSKNYKKIPGIPHKVFYKGTEFNFPIDYQIEQRIRRFIKINKDDFLFAVHNDLWKVSKDGLELIKKYNHRIISIDHDCDNNVWIGLYQNGCFKYSNNKLKNSTGKQFLSEFSVSSVLKDKEGGLWFATLENGIYHIKNDVFSYYPHLNTYAIHGDKNKSVFFSDYQGFLSKIEKDSLISYTFSNYDVQSHSGKGEIFDLAVNSLGDVLISHSMKGIFSLSKNGKLERITTMNESSSTRIYSKDSAFYLIYPEGRIKKFDKEFTTIKSIQNESRKIRSALILNDTIWVGQMDGLYFYSNRNKYSKKYTPSDHLFSSRVEDVKEIDTSSISIATKGEGLIIKTVKDYFTINENNGLISDLINRVFIDKHKNIWVATNRGISVIEDIDVKDQKYKITNITTSDGMLSNLVRDIYVYDYEVWMATEKGVCKFDYRKFPYKIPPAELLVLDATAGPRKLISGQKNELHYSNNNINVHFLAISYGSNSKILYRYKLANLQEQWKYTFSREINYPNLPPGSYTLEISALNGSKVWGPISKTDILISTPSWQSAWVLMLVFSLVTVLIYFSFKYKVLWYNKPLAHEIVQKLLRRLKSEHFIFVKTLGGVISKIDIDKILYLKASREYVEINTATKKYVVHSSFKGFYEKLPNKKYFVKIHRSYIVRVSKIEVIGPKYIIINKLKLPVSRTYNDEVEKLIKRNISIVNE